MKQEEMWSQVEILIPNCFRQIPVVENVELERIVGASDEGIDFIVEVKLRAPTRPSLTTILVQAKTNGQPRLARIAAESLRSIVQDRRDVNRGRDSYGLFVAPYISEKAASILTDKGIGYLDLAGNGRIAMGPIYVERKGNPNRFSARSELRTLFSPKTSRILRVLLQEPYRPWRLASLSKAADVSIGLVAKAKPLLLDHEWAMDSADGLVLTDPAATLSTWADNYRRQRKDKLDYYGFGSIREIEERIASVASKLGARYALTEFSGAERIAPSARHNRAAVYVESESMQDVAVAAELRPVDTGANVRLYRPYDEGVFYGTSTESGLTISNPVQLYLDLKKTKGRGSEAADFLLRQWLTPRWEEAARQGLART